MVEVQNDVSEVTYPTNAPGDYGEVLDYVARKGPISHKAICDSTPFMSPNEIHDALTWYQDRGHIERMSGDIEQHGTTRTVYYVPKSND